MRRYKGERRSGYEDLVAESLGRMEIDYQYEPCRYPYYSSVRGAVCNDCDAVSISKLRYYTPDFVIGNEELFIEAKGRLTSSNRTSMLDVLDTSDHINRNNFRLLLQSDNTYGGKGKRYSDWCEANGILYAVSRSGEVSKEWLRK